MSLQPDGGLFTSRFVTTGDERLDHLILPLHKTWWSRPYEYAWASGFADSADTVLDAACGVEHPFKFFLLDRCREVHACDIDNRILSREEILREIRSVFGDDAAAGLPERYLEGVRYKLASVTRLPYPDRMFHRVFCISVLEHLDDFINRHAGWPVPRSLRFLFHRDIERALREFRRVLADDGVIVLTFDHPDINLDYLFEVSAVAGLEPAGEVRRDIPPDALYHEPLGIRCFRLVLKKKGPAQAGRR